MTRLAVFVLVVLIAYTAKSFGQSIDDTVTQDDEERKSSDLDDELDVEDREAAVAYGLLKPSGAQEPAPLPAGSGLTTLVECLVCTDCPIAHENTTSKLCPFTTDSAKRNKCVVYAEKYKHMKRPWYIRGCASERGTCAELRKAHSSHADIVNLLSCEECEGGRCNTNGVSRSLPNFAMAFFVIVVTPLLAKYTLS